MNLRIEASFQAIVQGDLGKPCRSPVEGQKWQTGEEPGIQPSAQDEETSGEEFGEHERSDDPGYLLSMPPVIGWKCLAADLGEQGIVD